MKTIRQNLILTAVFLFVASVAAGILSCGGGGGNPTFAPSPNSNNPGEESISSQGDGFNLRAIVIKSPAGLPTGVRVTWDRVTDSRATGYYLYRRDQSFPDGNPEGFESYRANGGDMIDQPDSGDTVTFDDAFDPNVGTTWYYRVTVVNNTNDESDFSNEISVTIAEFTFDSFSPTEGTVNDPVTLYGTNFGVHDETEDHVYFTGVSDWVEATITTWSQTEIEVEVPIGAVTGPIRVKIDDTAIDSDTDFTVLGPVLDSVDPLEDYANNLDITLTGSRFEDTRGTSVVTFNGAEVTNYVSWSDTEIVVKVPDNATTGPVKVKVGANETSGIDFTVLPHVNSLSPTSGQVDDEITINGTGFGTNQGSSTVKFNGVTASIVSWGNLQVVAKVPETITGDVVVTVGGNDSNGVSFTVIPNITSFSPNRSWAGQQVTINGTGFGPTQGTSKVYFYDGVEAGSYVSWNANQIVLTVPASADTGPITVEVGGETDASDTDILIVLPPVNLVGLEQY